MSGGEAVDIPLVPMNAELLHPVHALQTGEALQRHFGRPRHELQELGLQVSQAKSVKSSQVLPHFESQSGITGWDMLVYSSHSPTYLDPSSGS